MQFISTETAPAAGGHYSQAVVHNGFVFVAGQLAFVPGQKEHKPGPIGEQTEQTLRNIEDISIVVPVYNPPLAFLKALVASVLEQTYSRWQLILADASTNADANRSVDQRADERCITATSPGPASRAGYRLRRSIRPIAAPRVIRPDVSQLRPARGDRFRVRG